MGGQSGDDGDFVGPGGVEAPQPTVPEHCLDLLETHPLEPDEATVFELTAEELVAGLAQPELPFHWVEFTSTNLSATHSPGPGETTLALAFTLRTDAADLLRPDEAITETRLEADAGTGSGCPEQMVNVPVWIDLDTAEGALDSRVKGQLTFYSAGTAMLRARFKPVAIGGTFKPAPPISKDDAYTWSLSAYSLSATVWNGGSMGVLSPEFVGSSTVAVGGGSAVSPPPAIPPVSDGDVIVVPEQWEAFAVWPRLEQCAPGVVVDMDDAIIGKSARDILGALGQESDYPLSVTSNATANSIETFEVQMTTTLPKGLVCVSPTPQTGSLELDVDARLVAMGADAGTSLDTPLLLTVRGQVDTRDPDAELMRVHFERLIDDAAQPLERSAFETATGVSLMGAHDEYTQVWWTWFGDVAPGSSATTATFVVTSPNARQSAEAADQVEEGGPGFVIELDENGQRLPGEKLFEATLELEP
jgi:hypothetical protein